jgi:hypothetical protein
MTRQEFAQNMKILNELLPKHARLETEDEIEGYYRALQDISGEAFSKAVGEILLNQKSFYSFPTIREIREICYKYDKKALLLQKAFDKILIDALLYEKQPDMYQNIILKAIDFIGGWNSLKTLKDNDELKKEKLYQFITYYLTNQIKRNEK